MIDQVRNAALNVISLGIKPNLVLLNAGTNDCLAVGVDVAAVSGRFMNLIATCLDGMPDVTIIASTILPNSNDAADACAIQANADIKAKIRDLNNPRVILADMHDGFILKSELVDGTHPNDYGYEKMAAVWYAAFSTITDIIAPAEDNGIPDGQASNVCPKIYGFSDSGSGSGHQTQAGSGYDDGPYKHTGIPLGNLDLPGTEGFLSGLVFPIEWDGVQFAQLINAGGAPRGGEVDELIFARSYPTPAGLEYSYYYFVNQNFETFGEAQQFHPPFNCIHSGTVTLRTSVLTKRC